MSAASETLRMGRNFIGIVLVFILVIIAGLVVADLFDLNQETLILGIIAVVFVAIIGASIRLFS